MTTFPVKLNTFTTKWLFFAWQRKVKEQYSVDLANPLIMNSWPLTIFLLALKIIINVFLWTLSLLTSLHQAVVRGPEFSLHTCTCSFIHKHYSHIVYYGCLAAGKLFAIWRLFTVNCTYHLRKPTQPRVWFDFSHYSGHGNYLYKRIGPFAT